MGSLGRDKVIGSDLGVMQGRLSPMVNGHYQAYPTSSWQAEFFLARIRTFSHIEWVVDSHSFDTNILICDPELVRDMVAETGVQVPSVCADFLMDSPLNINEPITWQKLDRVIASMERIGAHLLVVPAVDHASLLDSTNRRLFLDSIRRAQGLCKDTGLCLALETDLPPQEFKDLVDDLDPQVVGINYDIGNSASLGYLPEEEFKAYGERIVLVHVKDRPLGGPSVPLGTGNANIRLVLELLKEFQYRGPLTLQCFRDFEGLGVLDAQVEHFRDLVGAE